MTTQTPKHDDPEAKGKGGPDKPPADPGFEITMTYNGIAKPLRVLPKHTIAAVIAEGRPLFGSPGGDLVLVDAGGRELSPDRTVQDEGIKPHARLLLRPRTVRGG